MAAAVSMDRASVATRKRSRLGRFRGRLSPEMVIGTTLLAVVLIVTVFAPWVAPYDPFDPASTPRKRTALGRMNHEGCQVGRTIAGVRPAFYMGDDAQNEYIYKFLSATPWSAF